MFDTMTHATFKYSDCYVTAHRMVDTVTGKFYGWHGKVNAREEFSVVAKSLKKFEEAFIKLVDEKNIKSYIAADEFI